MTAETVLNCERYGTTLNMGINKTHPKHIHHTSFEHVRHSSSSASSKTHKLFTFEHLNVHNS